MEQLISFFTVIVVSYLIALFWGTKRQIGFSWSLFFCFFLSPVGGLIVTVLSSKNFKSNPTPSISKKVWGWILIVLGVISAFGQCIMITKTHYDIYKINALFMALGVVGLGYYLIGLGRGKIYNTDALNDKRD